MSVVALHSPSVYDLDPRGTVRAHGGNFLHRFILLRALVVSNLLLEGVRHLDKLPLSLAFVDNFLSQYFTFLGADEPRIQRVLFEQVDNHDV